MIGCIWIIFTLLFFALGCFHLYHSRQSIEKMPKISGAKSINGVSTGLVEFQEGLGNYVDQLNRDNRKANITTAFGYFVTAVTALFLYFLV